MTEAEFKAWSDEVIFTRVAYLIQQGYKHSVAIDMAEKEYEDYLKEMMND